MDHCSDCGHEAEWHFDPEETTSGACRSEGCACTDLWIDDKGPQPPEADRGKVVAFRSNVSNPNATAELERVYQAQKLLVSGYSWPEIARELGYHNSSHAMMTVRSYRDRAAAQLNRERKEEILELEVERLDNLIRAYWHPAMGGDTKSAEIVLKVINQQSRLLGLEELHTTMTTGSRTVVVAGNPEEYAAALKALVGDE